MIPMTYCYKLD